MKRTEFEQFRFNTRKGPYHENPSDRRPASRPVRLIAYYLPQFHAVPENDAWWGRGFTEWTNTTSTPPFFDGHYQPHLPADLGFYDLSQPEALRAQAKLARASGIEGFCFHHYWFSGRTILDTPINILLADKSIDLPFCLNWANESWSRRWDGSESDVLLQQTYHQEDDLLFAKSILRYLSDERYIRVDGRPLLMIYRPSEFPDFARSVSVWRKFFKEKGIGDPFIVMPQAFGADDPRLFGLDAAAGFPPHKSGWMLDNLRNDFSEYDTNYNGRVLSYADLCENSLRQLPHEYPYFPGVCPSWDNHARKKSSGVVFHGANPLLYGAWLSKVGRWLLRHQTAEDKRIVFINAWNEWAEGAHLEPDQHFGHAFLEETKRVLVDLASPTETPLERPYPPEVMADPRQRRHSRVGRLVRRLKRKARRAIFPQ